MKWDEALRVVCCEYVGKEFAYGQYDCCQLSAAYVKARTGIDHARAFRYDSEFSALKILSSADGIVGLVDACLGRESKAEAEPGDIVVCHVEALNALGIFNGAFVWSFVEKEGLCRMPSKAITAAWSV